PEAASARGSAGRQRSGADRVSVAAEKPARPQRARRDHVPGTAMAAVQCDPVPRRRRGLLRPLVGSATRRSPSAVADLCISAESSRLRAGSVQRWKLLPHVDAGPALDQDARADQRQAVRAAERSRSLIKVSKLREFPAAQILVRREASYSMWNTGFPARMNGRSRSHSE